MREMREDKGLYSQEMFQFEGMRDQIRDLLRDNKIDEACTLLQQYCSDTEFENELTVKAAQYERLQADERQGTLTREVSETQLNDIISQLLNLADEIEHRVRSHETPSPLSASARKVRQWYLDELGQSIENRIESSIHNARFIDLDINDAPSATNLPWGYRNPESSDEFNSFEEAFDAYKRRILLLGAPGSGKTTTLLYICQQLISEAKRDLAAPIPFLVNLSKFQFERPSRSFFSRWRGEGEGEGSVRSKDQDQQLERWLSKEFATFPKVSEKLARDWIANQRVAVLLDGLDEVDDEYRSNLVRLLNKTYLRKYQDTVVVVCSRINEYQPLQDRKETRLQLKGAVTLEPLTEKQINAYLEVAEATGLRDALSTDSALAEMSQTPLTLSMMTLAYGGLPRSDIPGNLSFVEQRYQLMEAYVAKMLQRKERRDRKIPADDAVANNVPIKNYRYSPGKINRYLGWLAVRLSIRMQTAFSLQQFYSFIKREIQREQASSLIWFLPVSRSVLIWSVTLALGIILMPKSVTNLWKVVLLSTLAAALYTLYSRYISGQSSPSRLTAGLRMTFLGAFH